MLECTREAEVWQKAQELKPVLEEKEAESAVLLRQVEAEQAAAEGIKQVVADEEADIAARTQETEVCLLLVHVHCSGFAARSLSVATSTQAVSSSVNSVEGGECV